MFLVYFRSALPVLVPRSTHRKLHKTRLFSPTECNHSKAIKGHKGHCTATRALPFLLAQSRLECNLVDVFFRRRAFFPLFPLVRWFLVWDLSHRSAKWSVRCTLLEALHLFVATVWRFPTPFRRRATDAPRTLQVKVKRFRLINRGELRRRLFCGFFCA